ncbi:MAG: hypothetical protein GY752_12030 [bacterium]|nr:hypothetical protein [bacterium]MCP4798407.1 hypothetical protein [bacterium]
MLKTHLLKATLFLVLGILLWSGLCCAKPMGPELRADQFFPFELAEGDKLVYQALGESVIVEGPATVRWEWVDGELFMESTSGRTCVRPLEELPHVEMTEQMIVRARTRYSDVPFIVDCLQGTPNPTNREWANAYESWLEATAEFATNFKTQFKNDSRDAQLVITELATLANQHDLVVPGSVKIHYADGDFQSATLFIRLRGVPLHPDGSIPETELVLNQNWQEPRPIPTDISRDDALILHHGLNALYESSTGPLFIDLSKGLSISTSKGR